MSTFLRRLLGKDDKFFNLLDEAAAESKRAAELLAKLQSEIGKPGFDNTFDELVASRRKDKKIGNKIAQELLVTFVTPIEREDIEALANKLYRIPKVSEKVAERISICPAHFSHDIVSKQTRMLVQCADILVEMVKCLRNMKDVEKVHELYERLQTIEGDADKLMVGLLKELYQGSVDAKEVMVLKDIYELIEAAIDISRDAGKVIFQTVLKYS